MITMARIQGSAMGYQGFQKPIIQMGQDSFSAGPVGTGVVPAASVPVVHQPPVNDFQRFPNVPPVYPYAYPVIETPVAPAPAAIPTWALVAGALAAGAGIFYLLSNKS